MSYSLKSLKVVMSGILQGFRVLGPKVLKEVL